MRATKRAAVWRAATEEFLKREDTAIRHNTFYLTDIFPCPEPDG
jgi:hypothetical protein